MNMSLIEEKEGVMTDIPPKNIPACDNCEEREKERGTPFRRSVTTQSKKLGLLSHLFIQLIINLGRRLRQLVEPYTQFLSF